MNTKWLALVILLHLFAGCVNKPDDEPSVLITNQLHTTTPISIITNAPVPSPSQTSLPTLEPTLTPKPTPAVLLGAGDISICGQTGDDETALLLELEQGEIFTAGDNSNEDGLMYQYQECFDPSWGKLMDRLHPVPGNHDYYGDDGKSYYEYFGERAGLAGKGYYSYNIGAWHIVALNSNCDLVSCKPDSAQVKWLREDLEANTTQCTMAYWHDPMVGSAIHDYYYGVFPFWDILYEYGAEIIVNGHNHIFEVFSPQSPDLKADPERGITQFIVGTGGVSHYPIIDIKPNSVIRDNTTFGVIKFKLYKDRYEWEFITVEEDGFTASGEGFCH